MVPTAAGYAAAFLLVPVWLRFLLTCAAQATRSPTPRPCSTTPDDGGGKAPTFARTIFGADNVARVLAAGFPLLVQIEVAFEPHEVNGQPGAILRDRDGKVLTTLALDVLGGRIQTIRSVANPDKLGHVGPVADAWAVASEVKQARRLGD